MAPRAGLPGASIVNGLDWQTAARGSFDPQRFSGALANRITPKCRLAGEQREDAREVPPPDDAIANMAPARAHEILATVPVSGQRPANAVDDAPDHEET